MMNNTNTKPRKVHQDSKLGVIPDGWSTPKITEAFQFINTTSFSRNQLNYDTDSELFYIHYGDIHATYKKPLLDFEIETNVPKLNSDVVLPNSIQYLKDGDVIIADASEDYEGVGEAIEIKNLNGKAAISGLHTFALRGNNSKTAAGFRTYIFKNPNVKKALKTIATGSKVYGISKGNIQNFKIVLPTLPEQQKIAQILATWDVAINKQEAIIIQEQQRKKALMQQLFAGKKRFSGFNEEWKEKELGSITNRNICYGVVQPGIEDLTGVNFIRGGDIVNGNISKNLRVISRKITDGYKRTYLNGGELLVSLVGYIGETALVPDSLKGANIARQVGLIDLNKSVDSKFVHYYISSSVGKRNLLNKSFGSAQQVINIKDLKKLKIPFPTIKEQQKISEILTAADNRIIVLQQQLRNLKKQKLGLMQKLLTGKIRVNV